MAEVLGIEKSFITSVRELEVFKLAYEASLEIHRCSLEFPKIEQYAMADQLRRSTKSICVNLAEGFDRQRQSPAEFKRFIAIAIGSCSESAIWIDYAYDLGYIPLETKRDWQATYDSVHRMLVKLRNKVKS
ncbi:MAG: four helix bundle protein [Rickettsiales bacterium]|nr:four helix bundle protein [Rickettsiales bacterium]